jgi:hypothetical protein
MLRVYVAPICTQPGTADRGCGLAPGPGTLAQVLHLIAMVWQELGMIGGNLLDFS